MSALDASVRPQHSTTEGVGIVQCVRAHCRPKDVFRIAFGLIWLIDAGLKWEPAFRSGFAGMLREAAHGQPGWLHGWFHLWMNLVAPNSGFFAYSTAVIETLQPKPDTVRSLGPSGMVVAVRDAFVPLIDIGANLTTQQG